MVVDDVQRVAVAAIPCLELTLEVGLPQFVAVLTLKAFERLVFARLFWVNTAATPQNAADGALAGDVRAALAFKHMFDFARPPTWLFSAQRQNLAFYRLWRAVGYPLGTMTSVFQRLARLGSPQPLVACLGADAPLAAQGAEIACLPGKQHKLFSLLNHSLLLPRHNSSSFQCMVVLCLHTSCASKKPLPMSRHTCYLCYGTAQFIAPAPVIASPPPIPYHAASRRTPSSATAHPQPFWV